MNPDEIITWIPGYVQRADESDEEYMWRKLSTEPQLTFNDDIAYFNRALARGLRYGEMSIAVAKSKCGYTMYDIESDYEA